MYSISFVSILLIALALAADCFAVALGSSPQIKRHFRRQLLRISLSFGIFQGIMPAIGWLAGKTVVEYIQSFDHWLAFVLLAFVGGRMIWESFRPAEERSGRDITHWSILIVLSVATSIDALAMGLSFAFLEVSIVPACVTIALVSLVATATGLILGRQAHRLIGRRAELIGGLILIAIGVRILLSQLLQWG
jgi:putative Mn2+ efflux pump MntP